MPLRVVIGRANAGKTGWILRWALEALDSGLSPTLVVPNLADARRLLREISGKAPLGVRVTTPSALAEELWQMHGDGRGLAGGAIRTAVMRKMLADPAHAGLAASARAPGFERLLIRAARQGALSGRIDGAKMPEATALALKFLGRYRAELGELGLIEPEWIGPLLAQDPPEIGFVGFLRFTSLSAAQTDFLSALSRRNMVCASLTWEEGFAPTEANDNAATALMKRADDIQVATETPQDTELALLADRVFGESGMIKPSGQLVLGEARGYEAEAALVAAMAGRFVGEGTAAERVAVVFTDLGPRVGVLRNAMAAEGLECDFDCPLTVGATSFGRALAALLAIAIGRGARAEALQFLHGPFSDSDAHAALGLDSEWRKRRQTEDSHRVLVDLINLGGASGHMASLCRDLARSSLSEATAPKWQELADALISNAAALDQKGIQRQDASAHRAVTRAVAEMASVSGNPFGMVDVLEVVPTLACAITSEESIGRVQIIQAARIGSRRFDEVIIAGLTQTESPTAAQETFASQVHALATGREGGADEKLARLEFYSLLTRARKRLSLVRQTVSSDGVMQLASPLLNEVLDLYRDSEPDDSAPFGKESSLEIVRCEDARAFMPVFTAGRREARLLAGGSPTTSRVVLHDTVSAEAAAQASHGRVFSATEIETYLECPYRWFFTRVLQPRDIDSAMDAAALGSRTHRLIADFYQAMKGEGRNRVTPQTLSDDLALFEVCAAKSELGGAFLQGLSEEIDVGRTRLWARHVVEDDARLLPEYAPLGHEVVFGSDPVFQFAGVSIAGRIDRLDTGSSGVVVTDYKSLRDVGKLVRPGAGMSIQHILYALAAQQLVGQPVVGSVYRSLRSRQLRGFWRLDLLGNLPSEALGKDAIDADGFSAMVEMLEERVAAAVEGIAAGDIPRTPRSADSCRYCALALICEGAPS